MGLIGLQQFSSFGKILHHLSVDTYSKKFIFSNTGVNNINKNTNMKGVINKTQVSNIYIFNQMKKKLNILVCYVIKCRNCLNKRNFSA